MFIYYSTFYYRGNAKPGETILVHGATGSVSLHLSAMHSYKEKPCTCTFDYFRVPVSKSLSTNKTSISVLSQTCSKEQCRTNQTFIFWCPSSVHAYTVCFSVCTPQGLVIHVNSNTKESSLHIWISQITVIKLFQNIALVNYSVPKTAALIRLSSQAKVPVRFSPPPFGRFSYISKSTALPPSGRRELSFLTSVI